MHFSTIATFAGLTALAASSPVHPPTPASKGHVALYPRQNNATNTTAPCAQASVAYFNQTGVAPTIPAQIAYDCIKSIPLNVTSAKLLIKGIVPYIKWQSTLAFLKNPPAEYSQKIQPPVDLLGGLDKISANIDAGKYGGEYEFGWDLYHLLQTAHDGHLNYVLDAVGSIFTFGRKVPLVSVSEDGKKLPSIFAFQDVLGLQFKNISYTPSPVTKIDGEDALKWAENWSQYGSLQDRDALYNNVFYELAQVSLGSSGSGTGTFTGGGRGRWVYPGATTTLTFANGTEYTMENYARVLVNMRGIQSGEDIAKNFFYYANAGTGAKVGDDEGATAASPLGYPAQVVSGPQNLINGYYVDAPGYEDVAVLSVPNFVGTNNAEIGFQQTTQKFLPKAVADGKKKLIIDVSANGGGTILQGYDLFKQLFPDKLPYGATRFRAHEAPDLIGQSFSALASQYPRSVDPVNTTVLNIQASYFDYHSDANADYKPFTSWEDKYGPLSYNNDNFTKIARWNLSDVLIPYNSGGINVTGYANRKNYTTQYFKPEDIVILTDGYCASTCTIFAELAKQQAGVKTIAMGGRSNKNAIQAIGGVKGTNNYQWGFIQELAQTALEVAPADRKAQFGTSVLNDYYSDTVFARAGSAPGSNVRDGLREGDSSGTPLQFIYEEADCRLYYTPEMTIDVTAIWKAAADAQWKGNGNCIKAGGYEKREDVEVTTQLKRRTVDLREKRSNLDIFKQFVDTFALETECQLHGDGFMHP